MKTKNSLVIVGSESVHIQFPGFKFFFHENFHWFTKKQQILNCSLLVPLTESCSKVTYNLYFVLLYTCIQGVPAPSNECLILIKKM